MVKIKKETANVWEYKVDINAYKANRIKIKAAIEEWNELKFATR